MLNECSDTCSYYTGFKSSGRIPAVCHPDSNPHGAHIPIMRAECHRSTVCSTIKILSTSTEFSNFAK